jgi:hypothetical protein
MRNPYQPGAKAADDLRYKYISVERTGTTKTDPTDPTSEA